LVELNNLDVTQSQWEAKVKALKDLLTHHLKEEEEELFMEGRKILVTQGRKSLSVFAEKARGFKRRFPSQRDSNGGRIAKRLTRVKG